MLVVAIVPGLRGQPAELMLGVARRFGIAIAVALAVLVGTGVAMASKFSPWEDDTLQAKLAVLVLVLVLRCLHIASPRSRAIFGSFHALEPRVRPVAAAHLGAVLAVHHHDVGGEVVRAAQQGGADPVGVDGRAEPLALGDACGVEPA
jgi:hypothetical protein